MSVKTTIKSLWNKLTRKSRAAENTELSMETVVDSTIFPKERHPDKQPGKSKCKTRTRKEKTKTDCEAAKDSDCNKTAKPATKRTRPTNPDYRMIDTDDNTCDAGKS